MVGASLMATCLSLKAGKFHLAGGRFHPALTFGTKGKSHFCNFRACAR